MAEPMSDTRKLQKPRKNTNKTKWQNPCQIPEYCKNLEKQKKTKVLTPCQILGHRFCLFVFLVLPPKTKKTKKQKYWPHARYWDIGSAFLFFFGFTPKKQKKQKKQKYWPHARYWDIGSAFLFFWFYLQKPKKQKKTKVLTPCQILGHRFCLFFLFFFLVFRGFGYWDMGPVILFFFVFSRFWILGHGFCHFDFFVFLVFRGFWSLSAEKTKWFALQEMDAHQTQGCIVQQMDAYMGFAGLKTVKKVHCHGVLFCF